jgi:hypothetical protein
MEAQAINILTCVLNAVVLNLSATPTILIFFVAFLSFSRKTTGSTVVSSTAAITTVRISYKSSNDGLFTLLFRRTIR